MNNKRSCNLLLHGGARHNDRRECYWYLEARAIDRRQQGGAFCLSTTKKKERNENPTLELPVTRVPLVLRIVFHFGN